jgi:hypothetical protein
MEINEQGLRRRIGSDYLIGCYTITNNKKSYFTDIRGGEGDVVKNPVSDTAELVVEYHDDKLVPGNFYSFRWNLNASKTAIIVDGEPEKIDNAHFLQGLFDARLRLSGSNLELFNNFQRLSSMRLQVPSTHMYMSCFRMPMTTHMKTSM